MKVQAAAMTHSEREQKHEDVLTDEVIKHELRKCACAVLSSKEDSVVLAAGAAPGGDTDDWADRIAEQSELAKEAAEAIHDTMGAACDKYSVGEWRDSPSEWHLTKARNHVLQALTGILTDNDIDHAITRMAMARLLLRTGRPFREMATGAAVESQNPEDAEGSEYDGVPADTRMVGANGEMVVVSQ